MILQSRKKRRITQQNTQLATKLSLKCWVLLTAILLSFESDAIAAGTSSELSWGRPHVVSRQASSRAPIQGHNRIVRDARVMAAVWDADDAQSTLPTEPRDRSVVVDRSSQVYGSPEYDPFDEDDRLAQLPDDPFDEPVDESLPVPEAEEDVEAVEDALEQEIKRRQSIDDPFEDTIEQPLDEDDLDEDPLEDDPLKELKETAPLDDDDPADELFQPREDDWQTPDLDTEPPYSDPEDGLTEEELEEQRQELARERRESEENCRQELADLEADQISSIDLNIRVEGSAGEDYPFECSVSSNRHQPRQWPEITYNWKAAALCHKPLYFEQVQLER